ncbi:peptidylprolyl isomerase [Tahibacter caeni]|uniref:peptidylprolyl isomerase n=1 Tax=Tahibacter caeni TaxID=1453545 RepID=UPI002147A7A6|nr:peptidylprolyl isomerase [Tahibacter caeni]
MRTTIPILLDNGPRTPAAGEAPRPGLAGHDHDHAASPGQPLPGPAPVFVQVGATPISEAEIAREMQHHRADRPQQARADAVRALVVRELLNLEIRRLGLAASARPEGAETHEEAAIRVLIAREAATPQPGEDECRRYFAANRARLREPDRARLHHILLAAAPADGAGRYRVRELGEQLIERLRAEPARFGEFAREHSACPSRDDGGDLGWIAAGDTVPEFERQAFRLKPGLAGLTVETRYGHHVVRLDERQPGRPLAFHDCRERIAAYLEAQAQQNAVHQYLRILAERYGVRGLEALEAA